ncbi:hypothetical protein RAS1_20890 [Phycisphaerae bacterium RAS1]|nr:hypothetical protein RAS1_20890 [Phycisphaerae bacterium RAS1]
MNASSRLPAIMCKARSGAAAPSPLRTCVIAAVCLAGIRTGIADADDRIERLNASFVQHVAGLGAEHAVAAAVIRREAEGGAASDADFVPQGLALLFPRFREALEAFDAGNLAQAQAGFEDATRQSDPYLSAVAAYFAARTHVHSGRFEEVLPLLEDLTSRPDLGERLSFAPHSLHLLAAAQSATLRFDQALATLEHLRADYPDAPELVRVAARELQLEVERRERGNLDEVSVYMDYSASRLKAADSGERVQERQQQVIDMLDNLIEQAQQQESQQRQQQQSSPGHTPGNQPAEQSTAPPSGSADPGEQHKAAKADPGQMWGRLPPAERERVLQSLRARFPSRYRQIVEQYYRSTAEQK